MTEQQSQQSPETVPAEKILKPQADLKSWVMVGLTTVFVGLYFAALVGWLPPVQDNEPLIAHLEPIIFVIVGYYFGRLPGQENEKTLKDEIGRQTKDAREARTKQDQAKEDAAQHRALSQQSEQKLKDTKAVLQLVTPGGGAGAESMSFSTTGATGDDGSMRQAMASTMRILE